MAERMTAKQEQMANDVELLKEAQLTLIRLMLDPEIEYDVYGNFTEGVNNGLNAQAKNEGKK